MSVTDSQQTQLEQIKADIIKNNVCPNLAREATNLVIGEGNSQAEIVFIGEAPGKKEDETGRPFVGAAGKFLDEMLDGIGISRQEVYITNIVKYRPPNNRDPTSEEKKTFWPYLMRQIEVISPKVIITLGRHSMGYFLPKAKIGEVHGQSERIQLGDINVIILPLYHPAAALYNGGLRQTLVEDFSKITKLIK